MQRRLVLSLIAGGILALSGVAAWAHGGATGVVKDRMELMESLGDAMKALTAIFRGQQDYDADRVRKLAAVIEAHGGETMTKLFPEGSLDHPSEALPTVWQDWERFVRLSEDLSVYAGALQKAADNPRAGHGGGHGMSGGMMGGGGMTGGGMTGGGMTGGGMMAGRHGGPDPERLASMAPDAAFMHLADICAACHQTFRKTK